MKKILALLTSISVISASTVALVSCSVEQEKWPFPKNEKIILEKKLEASLDDNEFNWDYTGALKKVLSDKVTYDYGEHDLKVGSYEVLKAAFQQLGFEIKTSDYLNSTFEIMKNNDKSIDKEWKMLGVHGKDGYEFYFDINSNQKINLSLDEYIKNREIIVKDGNDRTIISKIIEKNGLDSNFDLRIDKRQWLRTNDSKYSHKLNINKEGKGYIYLYSPKYEGEIKVYVEIENYDTNQFKITDNPYFYYDDRYNEQINILKKNDNEINKIEINEDKKVILLGLDGLRGDILNKYILNNEEFKNKKNLKSYYDFNINSFESVYGWKQILTGSISGEEQNIFEMIKNTKNGKNLNEAAITMWNTFRTEIMSEESIKYSFGDESYIGLADENGKYDILNNNYNQTGKKWGETSFKNVEKISKEEINSLKYKVSKAFDLSKDIFNNKNPNLFFEYDTIIDNMGHAGVKYDTLAFETIATEYAKIMNYWFSDNFKNDLVILVTDHGRNSNGVSHQGYDNDARKSFILSNQNLDNMSSTKEKNLYSIKEIILNYLKKG